MDRIYVDFQNSDPLGRARLNTVGSIHDLNRLGITLRDGLDVCLYNEEFEAPGRVQYSSEENIWTASYNWEERRELEIHPSASERKTA